MLNVQELKEKAVSFLEKNGPTIPVRIGKELDVDPMWAGAILSELLQHHNVKFSSMKVGSTPIYYLEGQEQQLEKFADEHLKGIPKETYLKLKKNKFLEDKTQDPQTRVALRSLKDFAIMFNNDGEIFWKYAFTPEDEIRELFGETTKDEQEEEAPESEEVEEEKPEIPEPKKIEEKQPEDIFEKEEKLEEPKESILDLVKKRLEKLNIRLLEETDVKKREFTGLGRMNGPLGETEILIIAKDKKNITDKDLEKIFEQIKEQKKQVLLFTTGEIAKKSIEAYRDYKDLIRIKPL
jgi:hypothetical protein